MELTRATVVGSKMCLVSNIRVKFTRALAFNSVVHSSFVFGILENENASRSAAVDPRIIKLEKALSLQCNAIKIINNDLEGIIIDADTLYEAQIILDDDQDADIVIVDEADNAANDVTVGPEENENQVNVIGLNAAAPVGSNGPTDYFSGGLHFEENVSIQFIKFITLYR